MSKANHLLVIRLSAMGDVAMAVPVLAVLRKTYPELQITVLSRPFYKPLFADIPNVQFLEADVYGKHKRLGLVKLAKEARAQGVDAVADLHDVIRSKVITKFLKLQGLKTAVIDKGREEKKALTSAKNRVFKQLKTTPQRYADVFATLGFPIALQDFVPHQPKMLIPKLNALLGVEPKKIIGIAPFAAHVGKMYPLSLMKKVIAALNNTGKYRIFLFGGGKDEVASLKKLEPEFANVTSVAGKLAFEEELVLISNLDLMLSMDSGNGHLAAMFGVPVVTIWGVTHPFAGFTPFGQPQQNQLIPNRTDFPLIPTSIYGNRFPAGYEKAIATITPELIVETVSKSI